MNRKTAAFLAAMMMTFSVTSCGSSEKAAPEKETTEQSVTETTKKADPFEKTAEDAEEETNLVFDYTGLDSEKAIKAITSDRYHMVFTCDYDDQVMKRDIYFDTVSSVLDRTYFMNMDYSTIYSEGIKYNVIDGIYFSSPVSDDDDVTSNYKFEGYGYTESGETTLDGKKYKYDEFSQGYEDSVMKLILNDDNSLYAIESDGTFMYIEVCDSDFNPSDIIKLPEGKTEVSEEEFNTIFLEKVLSNTESAEPETSSATTETDSGTVTEG